MSEATPEMAAAAPNAAPPGMPTSMMELLAWQNPVFRQYAFWTAILVIKMGLMSFITIVQRMRSKTDADDDGSGSERVERARRAHRNDLENIVPYILVSFVYTMTAPYPIVAINLFRIAAGARIWYTIVYAIFPVRQPARAIGFILPMLIMLYMSVQTAIFFLMVG